ncbi:MAG: PEP-CTERM sorting domain-containing protein [Phycisphaerales bacterium]|nr:PEP-CTERM sorting domain-containing protein [Planctomycetota bacterium]MCH8509075.1 PEP-CTERM sorting domain-containing protein [Phycisphaerales bacterium]
MLAGSALAGIGNPGEPMFLIADSYDDYAGNQGENGWFYGYYDGSSSSPYTPGDFKLMNAWDADNERWWADNSPGGPLTLVDAVYMHPFISVDSEGVVNEQWAVRRWVSNIDGPVSIQVDIGTPEADQSPITDGVRLHVFIDGVRKSILTLPGQSTGMLRLELFDMVAQGSVIDFAIDPVENSFFDATRFSAVIMSTVPTPASVALFGFGALAVSRRRR